MVSLGNKGGRPVELEPDEQAEPVTTLDGLF